MYEQYSTADRTIISIIFFLIFLIYISMPIFTLTCIDSYHISSDGESYISYNYLIPYPGINIDTYDIYMHNTYGCGIYTKVTVSAYTLTIIILSIIILFYKLETML